MCIEFTKTELYEMSTLLSDVSLLRTDYMDTLRVIIEASHNGLFTLDDLIDLLDNVVALSKEGTRIEQMIDAITDKFGDGQ